LNHGSPILVDAASAEVSADGTPGPVAPSESSGPLNDQIPEKHPASIDTSSDLEEQATTPDEKANSDTNTDRPSNDSTSAVAEKPDTNRELHGIPGPDADGIWALFGNHVTLAQSRLGGNQPIEARTQIGEARKRLDEYKLARGQSEQAPSPSYASELARLDYVDRLAGRFFTLSQYFESNDNVSAKGSEQDLEGELVGFLDASEPVLQVVSKGSKHQVTASTYKLSENTGDFQLLRMNLTKSDRTRTGNAFDVSCDGSHTAFFDIEQVSVPGSKPQDKKFIFVPYIRYYSETYMDHLFKNPSNRSIKIDSMPIMIDSRYIQNNYPVDFIVVGNKANQILLRFSNFINRDPYAVINFRGNSYYVIDMKIPNPESEKPPLSRGLLRGATFSPDGKWLVTLEHAEAPHIELRSVEQLLSGTFGTALSRLPYNVPPQSSLNVVDLAYNTNAELLLAAGLTGKARLWRSPATTNPQAEPQYIPHGGDQRVNCVAISHTGRVLATGGEDGMIHIWNARTLGPLFSLNLGSPVAVIRFSLDGRMLAASSLDRKNLRLWVADWDQRSSPFAGTTENPVTR
jgi:WD40 repeat protein